jgi:hypothetical protein
MALPGQRTIGWVLTAGSAVVLLAEAGQAPAVRVMLRQIPTLGPAPVHIVEYSAHLGLHNNYVCCTNATQAHQGVRGGFHPVA